ncbi:DNA repair protein RecO [Patescibacteria group bacterium]|nr:DNA repair protein RecO [Patescibacteria group bacterium]
MRSRSCEVNGVIIKLMELGEKDYLVTIITPTHGKIQVHAKGARRIESKFTGHLDLLNVCHFQLYKSPRNYIITECQLIQNYDHFRKNLDKFYISNEVAKMAFRFTTEEEENSAIYELLINTFLALENNEKENLILEAFKIKLLGLSGIMPDLHDIKDTEFMHIDIRLKKLLNFLLKNPYEDIIRLYLEKHDQNTLQKTTTGLLEYAA